MTKKEYALSFIEQIKQEEKESLYKFFTRNTVIVFLDGFKEIRVTDFVNYIEENFFKKEINIKRVLDSRVCTKIELLIEGKELSFLIEVKERRIRRLEVM